MSGKEGFCEGFEGPVSRTQFEFFPKYLAMGNGQEQLQCLLTVDDSVRDAFKFTKQYQRCLSLSYRCSFGFWIVVLLKSFMANRRILSGKFR